MKGGKWRILPILKRHSHTIEKCWTRPQSNVATSSTPPPLEDHGSHRVAGCCASFYFAVLSESGPITLEILKQLMSAITQKIEDLGPSHSANMANQVSGSAASSSIPSDWIRRFRGYQSHVSCFSRIRNGTPPSILGRLRHTQHTVQDFFHCLGYIPAFHSDGLNNSCLLRADSRTGIEALEDRDWQA
ncbi:hypothetical protein LguiA_036050 [Lonicera macranthoides]